MKYAYYPGCSLESTAREFDVSTRLIAEALAVDLVEVPDWNCCGATSAHNLDHHLSVALPARNLGIAESIGADVVAPCAACYNRMKTAEVSMKGDETLRSKINSELEKPYEGKVTVKSALEVFSTPDMLESIGEGVRTKLAGLRPACYYGCLLTRPPKILKFDDPDNPTSLDKIMTAVGAEPMEWYFKTECCGAGFGIAKSDIVVKLVGEIISNAKRNGANCIVTACPLCTTNLEMRQEAAARLRKIDLAMPIFYFTELIGLALETPGIKKCFASHLIDVNPALDAIGKLETVESGS